MPTPKLNETKTEFIPRCIPIVLEEGTATNPDQACAICNALYDSANTGTKIKELLIDDEMGIDAIALVQNPAIEIDFLKFSAENKETIALAQIDEEKRVITGPALIPNKMIYRKDPDTDEDFYVYFSIDTVKKISERYLIDKRNDAVNIEHEIPVDEISIIESWIVSDPKCDKSKALGYDLPIGSWFVSMKVNNENVWNKLVKDGFVKGFSIEGAFIEKFSNKNTSENDIIFKKILEILEQIDE